MKKNQKQIIVFCSIILLFLTASTNSQNADYPVVEGVFKPEWESLKSYKTPDWFRDAKFGIWAHWGPQCEPEAGDWYGRNLYIQGHKQNSIHNEKYGHPSVFGFKDVINEWQVDSLNAKKLVGFYKKSGAKYFVAMANHHDNFDMWNSKYQPWNSVNMGPKKNLISEWENAAKAANIPFGVSIHASSTWSWFEVAQMSDTSGVYKGVPYDGNITKQDGNGKWWEGYDPQDLYAQYNHKISPDVLNRRLAWKNPGDLPSKAYLKKYYNRVLDLMQQHTPELVYFDDSVLPLKENDEAIGLGIVASAYNASMARNNGKNQTVVNTKSLNSEQKKCLVHDFEVGVARDIFPEPWQVDACIGGWHYNADVKYKTADQVIRALIDVVSKNGNLLLSVPIRGNGSIDSEETEILNNIGKWLEINGEAIYGTRPWLKFGEGPSTTENVPDIAKGGLPFYRKAPYTAEDIRFTTKGKLLYAIALDWPTNNRLLIKSLGKGNKKIKGNIKNIQLIGHKGNLKFSQTENGLEVFLPAKKPCDIAYAISIEGLK